MTSQKVETTRRTLEAACLVGLGSWGSNVANRHLRPGPFNSRVFMSCLVPQSSHPSHWPSINHALRIVTGCLCPTPTDNLPVPVGIQPAELRQRSALFRSHRAMEPGHLLHAAFTCESSGNVRHLKSRHPFVPAEQPISPSDDNNRRLALWADHRWNAEFDSIMRLHTFAPHPSATTLSRTAWVRLNSFYTDVARFCSCLHKLGIAPSVACECSAEVQTVDHVVLQCPIHRPLVGLRGLTVPDDVAIDWLLNNCDRIWCAQAMDWTNWLKRRIIEEKNNRLSKLQLKKSCTGWGTVQFLTEKKHYQNAANHGRFR